MLHFERAIGKPERQLISVLFQAEKWRDQEAYLYRIQNNKEE